MCGVKACSKVTKEYRKGMLMTTKRGFKHPMLGLALVAVLAMGGVTANAYMITGNGTNPDGGNTLSASADFTWDNTTGTLTIVLTNTDGSVATRPSDLLTGLFFDFSGVTGFTPVSAVLGTGASLLGPTTYSNPFDGSNVGGEFAGGAVSGPNNTDYGISSAGLNLFGAANFNGPNLWPPPNGAVDGYQFGMTGSGGIGGNLNDGNSDEPVIQGPVVFTLSYVGTLTSISNVWFQYGTGLSEPGFPGDPPSVPPVPEPATVTILGMGIAAMALGSVRKRKKHTA